VIVFLKTWRASVISAVSAVPVSIVGAFAPMLALGFSINATDAVRSWCWRSASSVDDAYRRRRERRAQHEGGLRRAKRRPARWRRSADRSSRSASVLVAVFVPLAFVPGLTGQFYRQFALTIAISTVISTFNSLTLSPALAALLLKPHGVRSDRLSALMDGALGWFFRGFDHVFGRASNAYGGAVSRVLGHKASAMGVYLVLVGVAFAAFQAVPRGFVPAQDKQYLVGFAQLPDGASLDRTEAVIRRMSTIALEQPGVESSVAFPGLSIHGFANASNAGVVFVTLDSFEARHDPSLSGVAIAGALNRKFAAIEDAFIAVFPPPPVPGLGTIGGFKMQLEDRRALGYEALQQVTDAFVARAGQAPELAGTFSGYRSDVPQIHADVDRVKAKQLGVAVDDVFDTMQIYLGSLYVNDFNRFGRTYQVKLQADAEYRARAEDIGRLETRNDRGEMVPLSALLEVRPSFGPDRVMRGTTATRRRTSTEARRPDSARDRHAKQPSASRRRRCRGISYEWTELTYQGSWPGTQDCSPSRSPCCWCFWCSLRCTRAGRCRWR